MKSPVPRFFRCRPATLQICGCGSKINADHAHFIRPQRASQSRRIRRIMRASSISTKTRRNGLGLRFLAYTSAASNLASETIRGIPDFKGKTVGVRATGSGPYMLLAS
jgi:hypothetical protein